MTYCAADCLGFAGGFTLGAVQAGFELVAKRELPGGFGVANCEANRHLLGDGWRTQVGPAESWQRADADLVFGNPPCSGFSVASPKHFRGVASKVNACMWAFSDYVASCRPTIAIMESVRSAYTSGHELMRALRDNVELKSGLRYGLWHVFQNAGELGAASRRPRYFMVLSQVPFGVEYPTLARRATARDALADLEGLRDSWEAQPYRRPAGWWSVSQRSDSGVVDGHVSRVSTPIRRGLDLLELNGGWPEGVAIGAVARACYERLGRLPDSWAGQLPKLLTRDFNMGFPTMTMLRWRADEPARVVTGNALDQVIHPWLPRMITHREAARVMGFPDDWRLGPLRSQSGGTLASTHGKGITVHCGRWVAGWARRALDGAPGALTGSPVGEREWFVNSTTVNHRRLTTAPAPGIFDPETGTNQPALVS